MRLSSITFHNFGPFRGTHTMVLEDLVYAVVAKHEQDEERSNWLGKTTWLYGLGPFILYGEKPPSARTEDDWITEGESDGYVEGDFEGALTIKRSRKRGKSTQLEVTGTDVGDRELTKQPAQDAIDAAIGMTKDDFFNSSFFKQKSMDKFITARPSDRMEIASAWFNLAPLQACEGNISKRLNALLDDDEKLAARRAALHEAAQTAFNDIGMDTPTLEKIGELRDQLNKEAGEARATMKDLQDGLSKMADWKSKADEAERYQELVAEGQSLGAQCKVLDEDKLKADVNKLNKKSAEAGAAARYAEKTLEDAQRLIDVGFDGMCPVTLGECPARDHVDETVKNADDRIAELEKVALDAGVAAGNFSKRIVAKQQLLYEARDKLNRLEMLRQHARKLIPAHKLIKKMGKPPEHADLQSKLDEAQFVAEQSAIAVAKVQAIIDNLGKWEKEVKSIAKKRKKLDVQIQTHREALVIVGRNGAQRRRAERSLAEIERDANALLNETGIDLGIEVMWSREASSGLSPACDQCGAPYPRSQKVKVCHRCGATRGPKTIDKLDIELSDHSGAAEDLAGVAFQLAAAAWLRRERGTDWSIAFIDEPFSHLDAAHVKRLSAHFAAMLSGRYGFAQSFVVAHDRGIMDAMPGRVEIVASKQGSAF